MPTITSMRRVRRAAVVSLVALLAAAAPQGGIARAETAPMEISSVVAKVSPSVVRIITVRPAKPEEDKTDTKVATAAGSSSDKSGASAESSADQMSTAIGSGFIIDPAGYIATNRHVVEGGSSVFVMTADGERYQATVVGMPGTVDMALLRIDANRPLKAVTFGDSDKMRVGDAVIAIGSPFGFDTSVTSGIVSAINRDIMESPFDDYIQTDAAINHGNSGGPLFNIHGEVIGMNSVIFSPSTGSSGLGFALPSNEMRFVFGRLMKQGAVKAGMLPIHTQPVTSMLKQALGAPDLSGALVTSVHDSGNKMMHGVVKPGDVIMYFNGEKVWDPRDLARKAAQAPIGSDAVLGLSRGGVHETVHVEIHEWPEAKPMVLAENGQKHIGLQLAAAEVSEGKSVVTVASVDPMGTAADSGIQKGDIILEVQQIPVSDPDQALNIFHTEMSQKHKFAAVLVERDKKLSWMPLAIPH
ncbi:MAG: trypsin-like peptidase domain-containing protein [Rhodopila sp.]|jgi:serine protease Do